MAEYMKAQGLENLICSMLRGNDLKGYEEKELRDYIHRAGIALHNLPHNLLAHTLITLDQFNDINDLDPNSSTCKWGYWSQELAAAFAQELPAKC